MWRAQSLLRCEKNIHICITKSNILSFLSTFHSCGTMVTRGAAAHGDGSTAVNTKNHKPNILWHRRIKLSRCLNKSVRSFSLHNFRLVDVRSTAAAGIPVLFSYAVCRCNGVMVEWTINILELTCVRTCTITSLPLATATPHGYCLNI